MIIAAAAAPASGAASGTGSRAAASRSAKGWASTGGAIERIFAWINRFRRLAIRYERRLDIYHALTALACSLIGFNALQGRF